MLKFNLTQEGKSAIDALQNNDKLAITHIRLLQSGNSPSVDLPISRGAIVVDGTCNGPYVVVDVNDTSANNYLSDNVALLSGESEVATLYQGTNTSGYEVVLSAGMPGRNTYPSITYRTKTWASGKIPSSVDVSYDGVNGCDVSLSFGSKGGDKDDPSSEPVMVQLTLGDNFPSTITFNNGDVWETNETVSTAGIKTNDFSYGASSGDGDLSIRPLYSKISIQKESNKQLKLRLSCQFDGAEKCKFNTTSINLPYASRFREGVVRFADPSIYGTADGQRYNTVYSAKDVDDKINAVTESLGNLNQYAKINAENTFAENNTFTKNITVNGEIGGTAVTDAGTGGDKHIVNVGYADNKYLSKDTASSTYLSKNEAGTTYLTKNDASSTYLTQTDAETTYLTKEAAENAANNYAKLNGGNTFTGAKNTFQEVSATKFSGDGIIDAITENATQTNQSIPTDFAVKTYVDSKTSTLNKNITDLQTKDNDLQSQIDGINAGQNLADIVNNTTELAEYNVSNLKAKDDFQHGTEGATWSIGDKVQVLGDANVQSCVYELIKGTKPESEENSIVSSTNGYYWHYIGVYGTNAYTKSEIDTKVGDINNALDTKADQSYVDGALANKANSADVYSKTEADDKFAVKAGDNTFTGNNTFDGASTTINGYIIGTAVTDDIAKDITEQGGKLTTSSGVSSFVNTVVDNKITELNLDTSYLKLNSGTDQTVTSNVAFNGIISGTAVADVAQPTEDGRKLVTVDYVNDNCAKLHADNVFSGKSNTFQTISAQTVDAQTFTGDGVTASQMNDGDITQNPGKIVSLAFAENRYVKQNAISDASKIGAMGLFLYTGGDLKEMGNEVHGSLLHAVGMQLPMDGVVSWSQGTAVSTPGAETTWKLLNNTIAGEPCLVLAIRVG